MIQPLWRTVWRFLKKLKIELPYDPAIPLLDIYNEKTIIQKETPTRGTAPTGHPLNAGRKRPTSKKARNSPRTWVGQKKKEITETKE